MTNAIRTFTRRNRVRLATLATGALLALLGIVIPTVHPASAGSNPSGSTRPRPVTIDVIAKNTSFRMLPDDGFIGTQNLFDKKTGEQVGSDVFYCLEVEPVTSAGAQTLAECPGTATFTGKGKISILGSFLVPPNPGESWTLAVTGGTDRYKYVRGQLKVIQISPTEQEGIWTLLFDGPVKF
jgi:hypothetical protein